MMQQAIAIAALIIPSLIIGVMIGYGWRVGEDLLRKVRS